ADGTWRQPFDIVGVTSELPAIWAFEAGEQRLELAAGSEFMATNGLQEEAAAIESAEIIFAGYGIVAPEFDWNDYDGVDVTGKVVLLLNNDPDWDEAIFEGDRRLYYGRWTYKYEEAARQGAVGAIIVHTRPSAGYPWSVVESSWSGIQFELPKTDAPRLAIGGWATEDSSRRLVELGGHNLDALSKQAQSAEFQPVPLGITTSLALSSTIERTQTANIIGRLPGTERPDEIVLYGGHFDHLGVSEPDDTGDSINNGALDNASGIASILSIADAMSQLEKGPERSVVFAAWGAEESGLLGSAFYREQPTDAPGKIAANINIDGANIWGETEDVVFIGYGKSNLDAVVERHAATQNRTVVGDQFPDRGYFYRSDQLNLARIGVPAIYLDTGTRFIGREEGWGLERIKEWENDKYHQPSDELEDDWNFDGMVADTRMLFFVGLDIANADAMPMWVAGDEFEAVRLEALDAVR
ncbi:MAG: M28 family peptidase, partial [Acidobacteriota bacterium]